MDQSVLINDSICPIQKPKESICFQTLHRQKEETKIQKRFNLYANDLREQIMKFKINEETLKNKNLRSSFMKDIFQSPSQSINNVNIIIFGPTGAGKSSLIRTLTSSLNQKQFNEKQFTIKQEIDKEGTKNFTQYQIKKETNLQIQSKTKFITVQTSSINVFDTRGQLYLNKNEEKQIEMMIQGKAKNLSTIEQRNDRYPYLLWEFWKKDHELFNSTIMKSESTLSDQPHSIILLFDGFLDKVLSGIEEIIFYQNLIKKLKNYGYKNPQVVLTKLDKLEQWAKTKKLSEQELNETIDQKKESVVFNLQVPRENVHFLENYHFGGKRQQNFGINFEGLNLNLLKQCLNDGEAFISNKFQNPNNQKFFKYV